MASFETNEQVQYKTKDSLTDFRFLNLARNADKIIKQDLIFIKDVEIFKKNNEIT